MTVGVLLVDLLGLPGHVIHEEILAERIGRGEVSFAPAHLRDFLDEVNERIVAGEHKSVDHDAGALTLVHFFESLPDDEGVKSESVFVDAAVFEREGRRLAIRDCRMSFFWRRRMRWAMRRPSRVLV